MLYEINEANDNSAAYLKPIIQFYGGVKFYNNNEAHAHVSPVIWHITYCHFFSKTFLNAVAKLQESGILIYLKNMRILMNQKNALESYSLNIKCESMKTLNLFGLATRATSSGIMVQTDEGLECDHNMNRRAKIEDFLAAWTMFGCMCCFAIICFALEIKIREVAGVGDCFNVNKNLHFLKNLLVD